MVVCDWAVGLPLPSVNILCDLVQRNVSRAYLHTRFFVCFCASLGNGVCMTLTHRKRICSKLSFKLTTPCPHTRSHYVLFEMFVSLSAWEIAGELCRSNSLALELSGLSLHVCMRFHTSVCSTKESNVDDKMVWGWADFSLFLITYSKEGNIRSSQQVGLLFLFAFSDFCKALPQTKRGGERKFLRIWSTILGSLSSPCDRSISQKKCEERWESADYCIRLLEAADIVWVVRSICSVSLE